MLHSANFKRVVCPSEITAKTGCVRSDDSTLADQLAGKSTDDKSSAAYRTLGTSFGVAGFTAGLAVWLS
jgi:hypothetical protein